jgi:hypothetical protein
MAALFEGPMEAASALLSYTKDLKQSGRDVAGDVPKVMSRVAHEFMT